MASTPLTMTLEGRAGLQKPSLKSAKIPGANAAVLWYENPGEDFFTAEEWQFIGNALDFSARELEVAVLLVEGLSRQAIAASLHKADGSSVSSQTVRVYIDRIFQKAQVHDRMGLVLRLARVHRQMRTNVGVVSGEIRVRATAREARSPRKSAAKR